jgi:hypothetical protein
VDLAAAAGDGLGVLGGRQFRSDLGRLTDPQPRVGNLPGLMILQLQTAGQLARIERQLGQDRLIGTPGLDRVGHRPALAFEPAEGIEQHPLPALIEEPLLIVLAVDLDEPSVTLSSSMRAVDRPAAETSRTQMSGSGSLSNNASTLAESDPWRTSEVSALAPTARPSASISRLLPAPVSPVSTFKPGSKTIRKRSISARSRTLSSARRPAAIGVEADSGSGATATAVSTSAASVMRAAARTSGAVDPRTAARRSAR